MKLLAFDTSMDACSAALSIDGETREHFEIAPRRQAELILPMIERLLVESGLLLKDLDCLAFGRGPGSFTGLRIAAGVVQGLAFGADLPVVPVSTLAALAQGAYRRHQVEQVLVAVDARMHEIYWGVFRLDADRLMEPVDDENISAPQRVTVPFSDRWLPAGNGWSVYEELKGFLVFPSPDNCIEDSLPRAGDIVPLALAGFLKGRAVAAHEAQPCYLRDRVVGTAS